jgi:hypothetical protein
MFKTLFTDIQDVYGDAKKDLSRSLENLEKSLQEAGLLLITRVDENVLKIRNEQEGTHFRLPELTRTVSRRREILNWLSPETFSQTNDTYRSSRLEGSGKWFLNSQPFQDWVSGTSKLLIVEGMGNFHPICCTNPSLKLEQESRI